MSYLPYVPVSSNNNKQRKRSKAQGSVRRAFSKWLLDHYGTEYASEVHRQRKSSYEKTSKNLLTVAGEGVPAVCIIGGGFAGLTLANKLRKSDFLTVLVDKNNYHTSKLQTQPQQTRKLSFASRSEPT